MKSCLLAAMALAMLGVSAPAALAGGGRPPMVRSTPPAVGGTASVGEAVEVFAAEASDNLVDNMTRAELTSWLEADNAVRLGATGTTPAEAGGVVRVGDYFDTFAAEEAEAVAASDAAWAKLGSYFAKALRIGGLVLTLAPLESDRGPCTETNDWCNEHGTGETPDNDPLEGDKHEGDGDGQDEGNGQDDNGNNDYGDDGGTASDPHLEGHLSDEFGANLGDPNDHGGGGVDLDGDGIPDVPGSDLLESGEERIEAGPGGDEKTGGGDQTTLPPPTGTGELPDLWDSYCREHPEDPQCVPDDDDDDQGGGQPPDNNDDQGTHGGGIV